MIGKRADALVDQIDVALKSIAEGLNRGQPPYTGKLVIAFVDEGGYKPSPQIWKLRFTKTNKCLPLRVPSTRLAQRAAKKSSFSINHDAIKRLLWMAEELIELRKALIQKTTQMAHWEKMACESGEKKIASRCFEISNIYANIKLNLEMRPTREEKEVRREQLGITVEQMDAKGRPVMLSRGDAKPKTPRKRPRAALEAHSALGQG